EQDLAEAEYRSQRRAQLVRHARKKERSVMRDSAQFPICLFQFRGALSELVNQQLFALFRIRLSRRPGGCSICGTFPVDTIGHIDLNLLEVLGGQSGCSGGITINHSRHLSET